MSITHCIFDVDGLLLDTETIYIKSTEKLLEKYNVKLKTEWKMKMMGATPLEAAKILIKESKIDLDPEEFLKLNQNLVKDNLKNCDILPGVYKVLNKLQDRNFPMCIATGSNEDSFNLKMSNHEQLLSYFTHIVCAGSDPKIKRGKPFPDIFIEAMNRFHNHDIKPENILVFEDSLNGVEAALNAGMKVIWVSDENFTKDLSDKVIQLKSLNDFDVFVLNK